jgi:signal transduction histidine kinase
MIDAKASPEGTVIDVDDDGPGIPVADRERAFEPFVRLEETDRGAGLGLALVKRIVANHGGSVMALESPFGGCRIRTFWPLASAPVEYIVNDSLWRR